MSHITYDKLWKSTQGLLSSTLQSEPSQVNSREQRHLLAQLYVRYIIIANKLAECVDQMVQPQKKALIRKLLEATLGRVLELKYDLTEADLNEYTHCGEVLEELRLTPFDTELKVPTCFRNERKEELAYRRGIAQSVLEKMGFLETVETKVPMTEHQAVLIVQTHERARQGRLRAQFMKEIKNLKERGQKQPVDDDENNLVKISLPAALCIQKVWRGYMTRRITKRRKLQEMLLIGMVPPPKKENLHLIKDLEIKEMRRDLQKARQKLYEDEVKNCREKMEKHQRGAVLEQLSDQVRTWLYEYKTQTGKIPEYTGSERSTSRMLMSRQGTGTDSELSRSTQQSSKESKRSSKSPKKETKTVEQEEDTVTKTTVSVFVPQLNTQKEEYDEGWKDKDETANPHQMHCTNIIEQEQMLDMENELRKVVDEMMRSELQILHEALDRDRGHKGKKPKKASKKMRRGGKKNKKKKEKDLTPDRTTESLFEELVANGIIKACPEVYLKDFVGERSYSLSAPHNKGHEPVIALGDLRQVVTEMCAIPLLSQQLHESTPLVKSVLIAGPIGSGKDMLVHAVCTEAGATLFDLTPANIVGKYPGKSGLIMLIHLVMKVARLMQPSVIFMDNAERPFVKKVPKSDKTDPKRLKKDLPKLTKNFCPEDRILFIGVTNCPWEADQKLLQQVYQKYLYIPRPEYSSRFCLWNYLLGEYSAISWQFDYSGITKISDGYTVGSIVSTVKEVLTVKRTLQLRVQPLSPLEVINALAKRVPVYKEEEEAMHSWWSKTTMVKRRARAIEMLIEAEEEMKTKQANAKR